MICARTVSKSRLESRSGTQARKRLSDKGSEPCALVRRFGAKIVEAANGAPILDVGCGAGRNAIHLARLGATVVCLDRNSELLHLLPSAKRIIPLHLDLATGRWPFARCQLGGIVSVHFLMPAYSGNSRVPYRRVDVCSLKPYQHMEATLLSCQTKVN